MCVYIYICVYYKSRTNKKCQPKEGGEYASTAFVVDDGTVIVEAPMITITIISMY